MRRVLNHLPRARWLSGAAALIAITSVVAARAPGAPAPPNASAAPSMAFRFGQENSWIRVQNIGNSTASVIVSYYDEGGRQLAQDAAAGLLHERRRLVMLGYSGWAPNQLEGEIARGAWLPTPLDDSILFDVEPEKRWERAYALLGLTPTHVMSMRSIGQA